MDVRCFVHADAITHRIYNAADQALLGSVGDCNLATFLSEDAVRKNSRRLACDWNPRENFEFLKIFSEPEFSGFFFFKILIDNCIFSIKIFLSEI